MRIKIQLFSYFRDLAGAAELEEELPPGSKIEDLLEKMFARYPKLRSLSASCLIAVGVEYQKTSYRLQEGDEVSLFPPVQGG